LLFGLDSGSGYAEGIRLMPSHSWQRPAVHGAAGQTCNERSLFMTSKIYRFISAVGVSIAAFFELCFTGRSSLDAQSARLFGSALSLNGPGASNPELPQRPRPGIVVSRKGAGVNPPASALRISRLIGIGKYMAMLIFLVFCLFVVTCPSGRTLEDVNIGIVQTASADTGTEAPSSFVSRNDKIVIVGCVLVSVTLAAASIAAGLNPAEK